MSKSNALETDLLALLFNATAIANIADNAASAPLTSLYLALHTADPGEAGTQSTSEVSYTNYARKAVARSGSGFTVSGNQVVLAANQDFPESASAGGTATWGSVGVASSGATKILYRFALNNSIACTSGVAPRLTTGTTITED